MRLGFTTKELPINRADKTGLRGMRLDNFVDAYLAENMVAFVENLWHVNLGIEGDEAKGTFHSSEISFLLEVCWKISPLNL